MMENESQSKILKIISKIMYIISKTLFLSFNNMYIWWKPLFKSKHKTIPTYLQYFKNTSENYF